MISVNDSEVDSDSSHGDESSYESGSYTSSADASTDSEPAMSEVSDQYSVLDHAYQTVRDAFHTTADGKLIGGDSSLNQLESLPPHWPLAKLTLPLKFGVNRLDGLVVGYLMELMATHSDASLCQADQFLCQNFNGKSGHVSSQRDCILVSACSVPSAHGPH